jgi:O-antigen ligase
MVRFGASRRIELWQYTFERILERPLFGHGDGQFRFSFDGSFTMAQPHNVMLQVLYAWGVVGGLLCLALAVWAWPRFLKGGLEAAPFRYAAIAITIHSLIDGTLYHVQSTSLFALCCAVAIGLPESARSSCIHETPR